MALTPGTRLGVYEILALIGEGGMGQVYRGTDTTLGRQVGIKILPDAFAADTERVARFEREAKTLASLNHPNIAAIYGFEKSRGTHALVMELVEGDDLSQRIARGAIPIDEALPIAKQIAEALEAAHEQGIIHRDLKPANIKVRGDGTVKVLDFGLAKAMEPAAGSSPSMSMSPTITTPAMMTGVGMILGTAAYMSPEQAKGRAVDARADVWAFGVVLFEMLSGQRAFDGEDVADVLGAVTRLEPRWDVVPASVPPRVMQVLRGCLQKNVKARLAHIQDVRLALEGAFETAALQPTTAASVSHTTRRLPWVAACTLLVALAGVSFVHFREDAAVLRVTRTTILPPDKTTIDVSTSLALPALSPDGSRLVFGARGADGKSPLWLRSLEALTAQPLAGTDGASFPFWSPDSQFIGFFADGKLKKVNASGGSVLTIATAASGRGGAWSRDGIIVFAPSNAAGPLLRVSASGGAVTPATTLDAARGETLHRMPSFLPDGRHFLYTAQQSTLPGQGVAVRVGSLDEKTDTVIAEGTSNAAYAQGYLVFLRETTLVAQPFDASALRTTGDEVPIAEQVQTVLQSASVAVFSVSATGQLVYQPSAGRTGLADRQLTWFDRSGKVLGLVEQPGQYGSLALSPDGTRLAFARIDPQARTGTEDLWVHEFARNTTTRLTFDPAGDGFPVWSPDGSRLAWSSFRDGARHLYQKGANGAGTDEALLKSSDGKFAADWSPDGRFLLYSSQRGQRAETWVLPLTGDDRTPTPYLQQAGFNVERARFSPDGRFVAYTSDASGRNEVYVQPFPSATGGKWQVSQGGGSRPRWRRDGKELFYISADSNVMAVTVGTTAGTTAATTPTFAAGVPKVLFAASIWGGAPGTVNAAAYYDVTADGQKFLINTVPQADTTTAAPAPITVVLNWTAGLRR